LACVLFFGGRGLNPGKIDEHVFFCGGWGLNPGPCIFMYCAYQLS